MGKKIILGQPPNLCPSKVTVQVKLAISSLDEEFIQRKFNGRIITLLMSECNPPKGGNCSLIQGGKEGDLLVFAYKNEGRKKEIATYYDQTTS